MSLVDITSGDVELVLAPNAGGRIHSLRVGGVDILRTPASVDLHRSEPFLWGSYPLVPWCNRIPEGKLLFDERVYQQPLNLGSFAAHGRALSSRWQYDTNGEMVFSDPGDHQFPFPYRAVQQFQFLDSGIGISLSIENTGVTRMPAGLGIHPWFESSGGMKVLLPADEVFPSEGNIPTGPPEKVEGDRDLRVFRKPKDGIDECWTGLFGREIGLHRLRDDISIRLGFSSNIDFVVLASIPSLEAIAIEPQTHAVDGHARRERGEPGGIEILEPGEQMTVSYQIGILR